MHIERQANDTIAVGEARFFWFKQARCVVGFMSSDSCWERNHLNLYQSYGSVVALCINGCCWEWTVSAVCCGGHRLSVTGSVSGTISQAQAALMWVAAEWAEARGRLNIN